MDILRLSAIGLAAALAAVVVKNQTKEIGMILGLVAGLLLLFLSMDAMEAVQAFMELLADTAQLSPAVLSPVIKTVGIAMITKVSGELCRDAGEGGIAAFLEIAGSAAALFVSLPLLKTVLSMVTDLL